MITIISSVDMYISTKERVSRKTHPVLFTCVQASKYLSE